MMQRIVWVGWVGLVLVGCAAWSGFASDGENGFGRHLLFGVLAGQALAFVYLCAAAYLLLVGPLVRRHAGAAAGDAAWTAGFRRSRRLGLLCVAVGVAPLVWELASGTARYVGHGGEDHRLALWFLLPAQVAALWGARRFLARVERLLQEVRGRLAAAPSGYNRAA